MPIERHPDPHVEAALQAWMVFHKSPALAPMTIVNEIADVLRTEFPLSEPVYPVADGGTLPVLADLPHREGTIAGGKAP